MYAWVAPLHTSVTQESEPKAYPSALGTRATPRSRCSMLEGSSFGLASTHTMNAPERSVTSAMSPRMFAAVS
eukprot:858690-Pleurochrysis_carterae.AAC.1